MLQHSPPKAKADILIVDDKPENLRLLNQILNAEHKVRLAPSGEKGLDAARSNPPDLVLLDVMMPGLSGYEVASALKSDEQTRDVPIIFISALGEVDDKIRGFAVGGGDFITKPFQEEEVLARVRTHLSIRTLTRQLQDELTERKRAEEKLKDEEARYRAVVENQNELIVRWNLDGKRTFVNEAYLRCFGLTYDQAINTSFLSLVTEDDRSVIEEKIARLNSGQVDSETETHQVVLPDGKVGWQEWTDVAIRDETGAVIEFQSVGRDVTERKWTELVKEARSRIMQFSITNTVTETLQKVLDECEVLTDSCIGFFHFLLPDQVTIALQTWSTRTLEEYCFAEGKGMHYNLDKAGVWAESVRKGQAVIGNDYPDMPDRKGLPAGHAEVKRFVSIPIMRGDKIVAIVGVGNKETDYSERDLEVVTQLADLTWDIAERKMREEDVAKERENFLKIFSVAPVGLLLLNSETEVYKANQIAAGMILNDPAKMIGQRVGGALMCVNSEENPLGCGYGEECANCVLRNRINQALSNKESERGVEAEFTFLINDIPQQRWLRINAEPLELDGEKYVVVALDDITESKKAAEALQESEARIKTISDNFMDGMIYQLISKPDGSREFTYLSEAVRKLHGVSPEEGMLDPDLIYNNVHEDDVEKLMEFENKATKNLSVFRAEIRIKEPSGRIRWSSLVSTPRKLDDGSIIWDGFEFDITERREQEQQILDHQVELQNLLKESDRSRQAMLSVLEDQQMAENMIRRRLAEMEAINRISTTLRVANTSNEMLPLLLDEALAALESTAGGIWLYEPNSNNLQMVVGRGWCEKFLDVSLTPGTGIVGIVFENGEPHISSEITSDPHTDPKMAKKIPPNWNGVFVPIRAAEEVIGVILAAIPLPREITVEQNKLLISLAEMAGIALHRLRLYEETQRRLEYIQALRTIDQAIAANFDSRVTLGILLGQVIAKLHVDATGVLLFHPHAASLEYFAGRGFQTGIYRKTNLKLGDGVAGRAALERNMLQATEPLDDGANKARTTLLEKEGFGAHIAVPLVVKGELKGVLEVFHRGTLTPDTEWLGFLEAVAGQTAIAIDNFQLFEGLQHSNMELLHAYDATIEGWSRALDMRDKETEGHTQRVTELTVKLALRMGVPDDKIIHVRRGALLHDIGKMGIPDRILHKPDKLTEAEWKIMRQHTVMAYEMLSPIQYLVPALDIPQYHHEKWDGTGYPRNLKGNEIPLFARIFAIVDVWDALTNDRPYRKAWSQEDALTYIRDQSEKHFDPRVIDAFLQMLNDESQE